MSAEKWLIWSHEHNGWWKPNSMGYCRNRKDAGRFDYKEACEIVENANYALAEAPHEAMVLDVEQPEISNNQQKGKTMIDEVKQPNHKRPLILRFQAWVNKWSLSQALFLLACVLFVCGLAIFAASLLDETTKQTAPTIKGVNIYHN